MRPHRLALTLKSRQGTVRLIRPRVPLLLPPAGARESTDGDSQSSERITTSSNASRIHAHTVVTIYLAERTLTIEAGGDTRTIAQPVRSIEAHRPRKAAL